MEIGRSRTRGQWQHTSNAALFSIETTQPLERQGPLITNLSCLRSLSAQKERKQSIRIAFA